MVLLPRIFFFKKVSFSNKQKCFFIFQRFIVTKPILPPAFVALPNSFPFFLRTLCRKVRLFPPPRYFSQKQFITPYGPQTKSPRSFNFSGGFRLLITNKKLYLFLSTRSAMQANNPQQTGTPFTVFSILSAPPLLLPPKY